MFKFIVKAAKHSDADAVCRIAATVMNSEIPPDRLKKVFLDIIENVDQIIMIAINSTHTVGFVHARHVRDLVLGDHTEISTIALLPYYQRRGGGTSLLLGVEQWSRQMLITKLRCSLNNDNLAAKQLLTGCGYLEKDQRVFEKTIV